MTKLGPVFAAPAVLSALALLASGCGREADRASRDLAEDVYAPPRSQQPLRAERASLRDDGDRTGASRPARRAAEGAIAWAASRRGTPEENAQRQFERYGADFAVRSAADYAARARAFVASPPRGALTASRANGDRLYYDPRGNVFVVTDEAGLPRTMFKPRDGRAYWEEQQRSLAEAGTSRRTRRERSGGDSAEG